MRGAGCVWNNLPVNSPGVSAHDWYLLACVAGTVLLLLLLVIGGVDTGEQLDDQVIATTNKGVPAVLEGKSIAAREFIAIAKRIAGVEVDDKASVGFFTRIGRALGLSATPA